MRVTFTIDERKLYEAMSRRGFDNKSQWLQTVLDEQLRAYDGVVADAEPGPKLRLERDERNRRFVVAD